MAQPSLADLEAFALVARARSFRGAAALKIGLGLGTERSGSAA
jgi:hypothetical protein